MKVKKFVLRKALVYCNATLCFIGVALITVATGLLSDGGIEWLYGLIVASILMIIPLLLCVIQFCINPYFLVTDNYVSKISVKKTLCTIRRDEIEEIVAFIPSRSKKLFLPLWFVIGDIFCDKITIVYSNNCEEVDYKYSKFGIGTRTTDSLSCQKTQTDLLSLRETKELAKILGVPFKIVKDVSLKQCS